MHQILDEVRAFINVLAVVCLVLMLLLSLLLVKKYHARKKKSVFYLLVAFMLFIAGGVASLPVALIDSYEIDKIFYGIGKTIIMIAVGFFIKFTIEVFSTGEQEDKRRKIFFISFLAVTLALVWVYHPLEIYSSAVLDVQMQYTALLVIQGLVACIPFWWMGFVSLRLWRKLEPGVEKQGILLIGISGFLMAGFFLFNAINEGIGMANYWTIPAWISTICAAILFYYGVTLPHRVRT